MKRRHFIQKSSFLGLSPLAAGLPSVNAAKNVGGLPLIQPKALPNNATVRLVTPASALTRSAFERALENLDILGYRVKYSDNIRVRSGFLSGTDHQRLQDLHDAFEDGEADGIICARGGYGSARLLPHINYDLIRSNAKVFVGYSDITALLTAFYQKAGLICFHGPVGASRFNDFTIDHLQAVVEKGKKVKLKNDGSPALVGGKATGRLLGGNLSLVTSLIGTPQAMPFKGHLLFLEEIGESTYRIDRMLTQLAQSGLLEGVKGVAIGYFTDCDMEKEDSGFELSTSLKEVFRHHFDGLGVPVGYGFPFGHEDHNVTLPVGISAEMDADKGQIKLLESAVS